MRIGLASGPSRLDGAWGRLRACSDGFLHQHHVKPPAEFPAHGGHHPAMCKPVPQVQGYGTLVRPITNNGQQLACATGFASDK